MVSRMPVPAPLLKFVLPLPPHPRDAAQLPGTGIEDARLPLLRHPFLPAQPRINVRQQETHALIVVGVQL